MKLIRPVSILTTFTAIVLTATFAAEKKAAPKDAPAAAAAPAKPSPDAKPPADTTGRPLPMNSKVDSIDASTKSFTHKNKDGKEVKHVLSSTAEIKNGAAPAKFEDIKVGDTVSGLRLKKSETEYEVTKITKFGVAPPKAKGEKKTAEKK